MTDSVSSKKGSSIPSWLLWDLRRRSTQKKKTGQVSSDFGLHTLASADAKETEVVDLIAIHGLNGHFRTTWTDPETGINWLCDPELTRHARVMSFSYNSAVQFSKSVSDVYVFADQLLEGILAARTSEVEQSRSMIFICHSLGGIVFKQAVVRAYENERYKKIQSQIKGVSFFGTPHRGSDMAKWASIVGAMVKTASIGSSTNTALSKDLVPGSRMLETISRSFVERSSRLRIYSFFETQKMDFMNDVVVDKGSAVLGLEREAAIPVDGNHRTLCRFSDLAEARYQPVIKNLVQLIDEVRGGRKQNVGVGKESVSIMLESFAHPDWKQHKARNPPPLPGTCTWLFAHPLYNDWLNTPHSRLLWVSADPGCGKSVIASHLIDNRMGFPEGENVDMCYFFFKSDYPDQRRAEPALQGLILQLFDLYPYLKKSAAEILNGRVPDGIADLWEIFVGIALERRATSDGSPQRTFCILDGLDECDKGDRRTLTRLISKTFEEAESDIANKVASIKVLVLSRPDNAIKTAFDKATPLTAPGYGQRSRVAMIRLRGEDETRAISTDVAKVINASINTMIEQGLPRDLLKDVQKQLVKRADRTFLWITLILQLLTEKVESGVSRRELHSILDNRNIDKLYTELLMMCPEVQKARKALNILLAAVKPLTLAQLSIALAIEPDHDILRLSDDPRRPSSSTMQDLEDNLVHPFETHLKFICGNFIRIIHGKVYLVHETAREFLLESWFNKSHVAHSQDPARLEHQTTELRTNTVSVPQATPGMLTNATFHVAPDLWQHSFTLVESNSLMLQICTTFLYMMAKKTSLNVLGKPSEKAYEFLEYAAQSWWRHFGGARQFIEFKDLRYYENLCHPAFPAFTIWTETSLGFARMASIRAGRSVDQIQDYLVEMLGNERRDIDEDDDSSSDSEVSNDEEDKGGYVYATRALTDAIAAEAMTRLSSNPASQQNSYFPLMVDDNGFVAIDSRTKGRRAGRVRAKDTPPA